MHRYSKLCCLGSVFLLLYAGNGALSLIVAQQNVVPGKRSSVRQKQINIAFVWKRTPTKQTRRHAPSWTRWKVGTASVVSLNLLRTTALFSQTTTPERCEKTFHRFSTKMGHSVGVVATGPFFDPESARKELVGANILNDGTVTSRKHNKSRKYLTSPKPGFPGRISVVDTWEEVWAKRNRICAIELGPTVFPKLEGGLNEPNWETRRTKRYVYATRGTYEGLIFYFPHASPQDIWWFCYHRVKVDFAALLDGGSSIRDGSWYHVVFVQNPNPV